MIIVTCTFRCIIEWSNTEDGRCYNEKQYWMSKNSDLWMQDICEYSSKWYGNHSVLS